MERHFEHDIEAVREQLLLMGGKVEEMIVGANRALVNRDDEEAKRVRKMDDEVDALEVQVDEQCSELLVRQQPVARDLRLLVAALKITNDLERMGDCAVNIVKSVLVVNQEPPLKPYIDLPHMSSLAAGMVRDSLDAFLRRDTELARGILVRDKEVDNLYKQLFRELLTFMIEKPQNVSRALHLLLIARHYERIADHATNVAEDVVFLVEGQDVRHSASQAAT
jgi:phosphate transport system protein